MNPKQHWEGVYTRLQPEQVSWFQPEARLSLELIQHVTPAGKSQSFIYCVCRLERRSASRAA